MLKPGDSFERYTIEAPIGQGGMGQVYRAQDNRLGRRVALKVISERAAGPAARERLLREARSAAALDHPNAVAIFDVGELEDTPYIVMELVPGRTLRAAIADASLSLAARVAHLADAGRALGAAHRRGLVHRDVKPENVMIREDGMVKVLDFGIARRTGGDVDPAGPTQTPALPTLTVEGIKLGTPVYMAPEQIRGDPLDGRADQFAWGVVAYELLAGRLPWRGGDALAAMASVLTDAVDRAPLDAAGVSPEVQDVLLRALEKRPEDRFASMEDAVRALEMASRGEALPAELRTKSPSPAGKSASPSAPARIAASPDGATSAQRFSTSEVREVLGKAIEQQAGKQGTKLGFDDLLAVAAEVGVDPESLREATRALRAQKEKPAGGADDSIENRPASIEKADPRPAGALLSPEDAARRDAWLRSRKRAFHRHAGVFAIVNGAFLILGLVLLSFTPWWVWFIPGLFWAIGLAIHGLVALSSNEDDWAEHDRTMKWWLEQRRLKHEERLAWSRGRAHALPAPRPTTEAPRGRIQPTRDTADKLRVADTAGDRAAEEEAALADQHSHDRDRRRR